MNQQPTTNGLTLFFESLGNPKPSLNMIGYSQEHPSSSWKYMFCALLDRLLESGQPVICLPGEYGVSALINDLIEFRLDKYQLKSLSENGFDENTSMDLIDESRVGSGSALYDARNYARSSEVQKVLRETPLYFVDDGRVENVQLLLQDIVNDGLHPVIFTNRIEHTVSFGDWDWLGSSNGEMIPKIVTALKGFVDLGAAVFCLSATKMRVHERVGYGDKPKISDFCSLTRGTVDLYESIVFLHHKDDEGDIEVFSIKETGVENGEML